MRAAIRNNILWSYANWGVTGLAPIVMVPLYVRFLGTKTYGEWLVILSITSYLGLANLGLAQTFSNRVADAVGKGRHSDLGELLATAFLTFAAIGAVLLVVLFFLTPWIAGRLDMRNGTVVLTAFALYLGLNLLSFPLSVYPMLLRGFERVDQEQAINAITNIARIAALAALLSTGFKLVAVALVNGFAAMALSSVAYFWSRRLSLGMRLRPSQFSIHLLREMGWPSLAFLAIQIGSTLATGVDNLVIGYMLGATAVTIYAVPFRLMTICAGLFGVVLGALLPTITINFARRAKSELHEPFIFAMRVAIGYGTAGAIALWISGPTVLRLWVGRAIFPGFATFGLQIVMFWAMIWVSVPSAILWAITRNRLWSLIAVLEGGLNLVLSLWWVHRWGLAGVIAGTVAATSVTGFWFIPWAAFAALEFPRGTAIRRLAPSLMLSALSLGGVFAFTTPNPHIASVMTIAFKVLCAESAFLALYACFAISAGDRRRVLAWLTPPARRVVPEVS